MKTKVPPCQLDSISPEMLQRASEILKVLAHPMRLKIIDLIHTAHRLPVSRISEHLDLAQPATSQHLNHMRRVGLLHAERQGKEVWYSIADPRPISLLDCICCCCKPESNE